MVCWEAYDFFVVSRGGDYYSDRPNHLLLVVALAVPIGLAVSLFFWLRARKRPNHRCS
jgi:hypothetical protein